MNEVVAYKANKLHRSDFESFWV